MLAITTRFPKKRAFITGAGAGIGLSLARKLAADGWTIAVNDFRDEAAARAVDELASLGGKPEAYVFDVTDRGAFEGALARFAEAHGGFDVIVNNAGVAVGGPMGETSLEDWDWVIGINLMGVVYGCHFALPYLREQKSGHILNISSASAFTPIPNIGAYGTAKAGVKYLSEILYNELYDAGVGVTVAMPEFIRTDLHERSRGPAQNETHVMITRAKYTPDDFADMVWDAIGRNRLYVVYGKNANRIWRLRHWFPKKSLDWIRQVSEAMRERITRRLAREPESA